MSEGQSSRAEQLIEGAVKRQVNSGQMSLPDLPEEVIDPVYLKIIEKEEEAEAAEQSDQDV